MGLRFRTPESSQHLLTGIQQTKRGVKIRIARAPIDLHQRIKVSSGQNLSGHHTETIGS